MAILMIKSEWCLKMWKMAIKSSKMKIDKKNIFLLCLSHSEHVKKQICKLNGMALGISSSLCFDTFCLFVCLSVGMFPRHGYSFKDTTVWSSPNDSKCVRLGVSVLKISNLPIPEVAFKKNVKILTFFPQLGVVLWDLPWMYTLLSYMHWTFFLLRVKWWTEVVYSLDLLINTSVLFMCTFIIHKKKVDYFHWSKM